MTAVAYADTHKERIGTEGPWTLRISPTSDSCVPHAVPGSAVSLCGHGGLAVPWNSRWQQARSGHIAQSQVKWLQEEASAFARNSKHLRMPQLPGTSACVARRRPGAAASRNARPDLNSGWALGGLQDALGSDRNRPTKKLTKKLSQTFGIAAKTYETVIQVTENLWKSYKNL